MLNTISFIKTQNNSFINPHAIAVVEPSGHDTCLKLVTGETMKLEGIKPNIAAQTIHKAANTGEILDIKA